MTSSNYYYDSENVDINNMSPCEPLWYESPETPYDDFKCSNFDDIKKDPDTYPSESWAQSPSFVEAGSACVPTPKSNLPPTKSHRMMPYQRPTGGLSPKSSASSSCSSRGRPSKVTSNSKMATYARNYREIKKSQMAQCTQQNEELKAENFRLRMDNHELQSSLTRLEQEIGHLREAFSRTSSIVSAISCLKGSSEAKPSAPSDLFNGFCLHLMDGRFSFEVCQHCSTNAREKLNPEVKPNSNTNEVTPLFNGDFESISKFPQMSPPP
ncbi:unnamed protein product [Auanema sp. JU1783]|nr:unnamed protein product [Auanema sp. JU1783]